MELLIQFNYRKHLQKGMADYSERKGGEAYEMAVLVNYMKNVTADAKDSQLTSCFISHL